MLGRSLLLKASSQGLYPGYVQQYIDRVIAADVAAGNTQGLEIEVTNAISTCLQALVADGILGVSGGILSQSASLIKAGCFMMGARTLPGALVPLAADMPAPTNVGFLSDNYNRRLGLGDPSNTSKYLNSNRANNADSQTSAHIAAYGTSWGATTSIPKFVIGRQVNGINERAMAVASSLNSGNLSARVQSNAAWSSHGQPRATGLIGASRSTSTQISIRNNGSTVIASQASPVSTSATLFVFASSDGIGPGQTGNPAAFDDSILNFYSIGTFLDLAILDARITALSSAIQAAIAL